MRARLRCVRAVESRRGGKPGLDAWQPGTQFSAWFSNRRPLQLRIKVHWYRRHAKLNPRMCTTPAKTPRPRPSHEALCRGSAWAGEGPPRHAARSSAAEPGGNHTDGSPRGRFETRTQPSVGRKPPCASLFPPHHPTPRRCSLWGGRRLAAPCNRALAATPCAQPLNVIPPPRIIASHPLATAASPPRGTAASPDAHAQTGRDTSTAPPGCLTHTPR